MKNNIQKYINKRLQKTDKLYDYSLIDSVKQFKLTDKITVICPDHGEFTTSARNHFIQGRQCPACAKKAPVHKSELIKRRTAKMYDYSLIPDTYVKSQDFVAIICPDHGEFKQRCYAHFKNQQLCPQCANEKRKTKLKFKNTRVYTDNHGHTHRIYDHNNNPTHWISDNISTDQVNQSYGYTYIITNLVNNKSYIGKRKISSTLNNRQHNSWQSYKGSSNAIKAAINEYGIDNFKFVIMAVYQSAEDLRGAEIELIINNNATTSDNFYNIALT